MHFLGIFLVLFKEAAPSESLVDSSISHDKVFRFVLLQERVFIFFNRCTLWHILYLTLSPSALLEASLYGFQNSEGLFSGSYGKLSFFLTCWFFFYSAFTKGLFHTVISKKTNYSSTSTACYEFLSFIFPLLFLHQLKCSGRVENIYTSFLIRIIFILSI